MATACVNVRIVCSLFTAAVVFACAIAALPVDGAPQSSVDDASPSAEEFRGAASPGRSYASRLHQLQMMTAARHGIARLVPVLDRKAIVDDKRDDSSAAFDVDYGWGGGRFGKRRNGDALGLAGRFGRSVAGYDVDNADDRS